MTLAKSPILYDVVKGGSPQSWISRTSRSVSLQYRPLRCKFGIISLQSEQSASQRHLSIFCVPHFNTHQLEGGQVTIGLGRIACSLVGLLILLLIFSNLAMSNVQVSASTMFILVHFCLPLLRCVHSLLL